MERHILLKKHKKVYDMTDEELAIRIQEGVAVKESLLLIYNQNMGMIKGICKKMSHGQEMEDLLQQAYIGIHLAAFSYQKNKGASFASFASVVIKRELTRYIANCGQLIKIAEREQYRFYRYRRLENYYLATYNRKPTEEEAAQYMHVRKTTIERIKKIYYQTQVVSLDDSGCDDSDEDMD